ncbi:MAG: hypothetical protein IPJ65_10400 [Archangiaceae bacterium]|nr:hypothetical protein [Archangiaceae bacterium]
MKSRATTSRPAAALPAQSRTQPAAPPAPAAPASEPTPTPSKSKSTARVDLSPAQPPQVKRELLDVATSALARIDGILKSGRALTHADENWLAELQTSLGRGPVTMSHPEKLGEQITLEGPLSVDFINRDVKTRLGLLAHTLRAQVAATAYRPVEKQFTGYRLPVHNSEIAAALKDRYRSEDFAALLDLSDSHGAFHIAIDAQTGIGKTTEIDPAEDDIMSQLWVTDAVRFGRIQNARYPEERQRALNTLARFYKNERAAFDEAIADPAAYRDAKSKVGVHHLFYPESVEAFPWLAPKRLESHGLALGELSRAIVAGAKGEPWGLKAPSDEVVQSLAYLVKFFDAIGYETAPSNGIWEELVFADGLTWDVEAVRAGLEQFADLQFNPAYDALPSVKAVRRALAESKFGGLLTDRAAIEALIARGQRQVEQRVLREVPTENPSRNADSSLAFITASSIRLGKTPVEDISAHLRILEYLEETLLQPNGVVKYAPFELEVEGGSKQHTFDSYLVPNWGLASDVEGRLTLHRFDFEEKLGLPLSHVEPSTPDRFVIRSTYAEREDKPSEWSFQLSEMARGYGVQLRKLLDVLETKGHVATADEQALLTKLQAKSTELINRGYAQITGSGEDGRPMVKANGWPARPWAVPEAYSHVSSFEVDADGERVTRMLPGVNTPLGWSTATLFSASELFLENLRRIERLSPA